MRTRALLALVLCAACNEAAVSVAPVDSSGGSIEPPPDTAPAITRRLIPPGTPVPAAYFGMHMHRMYDRVTGRPVVAWPTIGFGGWRLWDAGVNWFLLEPTDDAWRLACLDSSIAAAERSGVRVLLTLGSPPAWASARPTEASPYAPGAAAPPSRIADWRNYVDTLSSRYRGRIEAYEIWNEPNLPDYFTGTTAEMLELAREASQLVRRNDPGARMLTPSPTAGMRGVRWLDAYLRGGGDAYADIIAFHFYVDPGAPEAMLPVLDSVRHVLASYGIDKPIWNTETGWYIPNTMGQPPRLPFEPHWLTQEESVAYVSRSLVLGWCSGMARFYWYAWDNTNMGMTDGDYRTPKPIARAWETTRRWLTGARVLSCERNDRGVWQATLVTPAGARQAIFWHEDAVRDADATVANAGAWCPVERVSGEPLGGKLAIGAAPVLAAPCGGATASAPR